jgi:flagellar hook protein FlgE
MLRSLFAGISGLRAHQQMMDVTANNIANVNTTGFKSSQTTFEDTLSQMVTAAGAPTTAVGGTNPAQVGLGVRLAGVTNNFTQGATQNTGRNTDLLITGDGFFMVKNATETLYTRAGTFSFDTNGDLVAPDGAKVQGWNINPTTGLVNTSGALTGVHLPIGTLSAPTPTTKASTSGNLPGDAAVGAQVTTSVPTYDAQGNPITLQITFTNNSSPTLEEWNADFTLNTNPPTTLLGQTIDFTNGKSPSLTTVTVGGIQVDLSGLTDYAGSSTLTSSADGSGMGSLQSFAIAQDGMVVGTFSNGMKQTLAQIALASFTNPPGLEKAGDSDYRATVNSGVPQIGNPGTGGRGLLQSGALEMSNVDLAQEFTNLVIAQRGFEANSKVITSSDELLQDLVNLKR